jgi:2,3-bisphosphoglycerate-independent phosphoglycerate mutase
MPPPKRILLCILDGWGVRHERAGNAIALAGTPTIDAFAREFPSTELLTSGLAVGLPEGQMGNSEVGHTNIGAGRVVYQDLVRINLACERGELEAIEPLRAACDSAASDGRALHLAGLCSDGGVHSSLIHLYALIDMAVHRGVRRLFVHAFTDGRDTPPDSGAGFIHQIEEVLRQKGLGRIATVSGRYFAMDRDQRWDRIEKAYRALVDGAGVKASSAEAAVLEAYQRGETDEFIAPTVVVEDGEPIGRIRDGDSFIFFNFRADRARELTRALALPGFQSFARDQLKLGEMVCMTEYEKDFGLPVAFDSSQPHHILPELLSQQGWPQFRCAETEKYAHVTFFFNGGREAPFPGEDRVLVPSPRDVPTYDLKPAMNAPEVTARLQAAIASEQYPFLLVNYANPDMVGHTGVLSAAIEAVKVVDHCLGQVWETARAHRTSLVVTADHGNCETMIDPITGGPHTQHTLNPVPFYLVDPDSRGLKLRPGILAGVAPTLLTLYGLEQPRAMSGKSLLRP